MLFPRISRIKGTDDRKWKRSSCFEGSLLPAPYKFFHLENKQSCECNESKSVISTASRLIHHRDALQTRWALPVWPVACCLLLSNSRVALEFFLASLSVLISWVLSSSSSSSSSISSSSSSSSPCCSLSRLISSSLAGLLFHSLSSLLPAHYLPPSVCWLLSFPPSASWKIKTFRFYIQEQSFTSTISFLWVKVINGWNPEMLRVPSFTL